MSLIWKKLFDEITPEIVLSGTLSGGVLETTITDTAYTLIFTLGNGVWEPTLGDNNAITTAFIAGITGDSSEFFSWNAFGQVTFNAITRDSDTQVTLTTPVRQSYGVTSNEILSIIVPGIAVVGDATASAEQNITITNEDPILTLTGTLLTADEADIVAGGKTLIFTLAGCNWLEDTGVGAFETGLLIDSITGNGGAGGWTLQVTPNIDETDFTQSSPHIVTLTLPAIAGYTISVNETISVNVHAFTTMGEVSDLPQQQFNILNLSPSGTGALLLQTGGTDDLPLQTGGTDALLQQGGP